MIAPTSNCNSLKLPDAYKLNLSYSDREAQRIINLFMGILVDITDGDKDERQRMRLAAQQATAIYIKMEREINGFQQTAREFWQKTLDDWKKVIKEIKENPAKVEIYRQRMLDRQSKIEQRIKNLSIK